MNVDDQILSRIDVASDPFRVRWEDMDKEFVKISHELLAERPTIDVELPWGLERVEVDDECVVYRRTVVPTGDFEPLREVSK